MKERVSLIFIERKEIDVLGVSRARGDEPLNQQ
jgi:hypothetical protein